MADIHVSVPSELLVHLGPVPITNSVAAAFLTSLIIIALAMGVRFGAGIIPTKRQVFFESIYGFINEKLVQIFGSEERAERFFPLMFTMFLFLLMANQFALLPFIQSLVTPEGEVVFRTPTSDYSLPIALSVFILLMANVMAFAMAPIRYVGNFFKIEGLFKIRSIKELPMALLDIFMGLMDIIGELAKVVSLATRLFGNIFAGEVLVTVIIGLMVYTQFLVPVPFMAISVLSGLVQAFVFTMLSTIYVASSLGAVNK